MTPTPNPARWTGPVIRLITRNLPVLDPEAREWDHMCCTAWQFGCEALAALGQAEETDRGARPLPHPQLPERLPRWDDICVTVLKGNARKLQEATDSPIAILVTRRVQCPFAHVRRLVRRRPGSRLTIPGAAAHRASCRECGEPYPAPEYGPLAR